MNECILHKRYIIPRKETPRLGTQNLHHNILSDSSDSFIALLEIKYNCEFEYLLFTHDHRKWAKLVGTVNHKKMLYSSLK